MPPRDATVVTDRDQPPVDGPARSRPPARGRPPRRPGPPSRAAAEPSGALAAVLLWHPTAPLRPAPAGRTWNRARVGRLALVVCATLVLLATGTGWVALRTVAGHGGLTGGTHAAGGPVNILLIGLDTRRDRDGAPLPASVLDQLHAGDGGEGGYNTNTLILVHVPAGGGEVTAFSIPRDDLVPIPGYRTDKIKQAYGVTKASAEQRLRAQGVADPAALEQAGRDAGRRASVGAVEALTGLTVDHYAEVSLAGFYDLAGALGGVEVCLNHAVSDDYSGADFPAGDQMLDGAQALAFVRQRHGLTNGDLDRTHRQQAFLSSAMHRLTGAGTWTDPARLTSLLSTARRDVVLDQGWDVLSFATQAQDLTDGNAAFYTLPIEGFVRTHDEDANLVDATRVRSFVRDTIATAARPPAPPPAPPAPVNPAAAVGITVSVDNASRGAGRASTIETLMVDHGFSPGPTSTVTTRSASTVAAAPGDHDAAVLAASLLGPQVGIVDDPSVPAHHLRIVLGTGYRPPAPPGAAAPGPAGPPVTAGGVPCVD